MKKTLLISILGLAFILSACSQQPSTKDNDKVSEPEQKVFIDLKEKGSQEPEKPNSTEKPENIKEDMSGWQKYDKEISNLVKNNYFNGITSPDIISCSNNIKDEVKSTENKMSFYGGRTVNGLKYDKKNNCIRWNKDCEEEILNSEEKQIQKIINRNRFNVINGCLYDGQNKALKYNLFAYTHTDFFGQKTDGIGEAANEWFRFEHNNNLYIFLKGGAGCGGCVFNGPYLIINLNSGAIKGEYSDLPYLPYLVLSPNKKMALEANWDEGNNTKIYLFDFITNKREKLIFEIPKDKSILVQGHGVYLMEDAVIWVDNSTVKIQLYEQATDGYAKSEYIDNVGIQYFKAGEPVIVKIDN
ncbi:hypothetical protein GF322_01970 [Candidatus Dependentiae bacterium]|nr:hypothetical protein [Candidatus Dependentiae bacterium]